MEDDEYSIHHKNCKLHSCSFVSTSKSMPPVVLFEGLIKMAKEIAGTMENDILYLPSINIVIYCDGTSNIELKLITNEDRHTVKEDGTAAYTIFYIFAASLVYGFIKQKKSYHRGYDYIYALEKYIQNLGRTNNILSFISLTTEVVLYLQDLEVL